MRPPPRLTRERWHDPLAIALEEQLRKQIEPKLRGKHLIYRNRLHRRLFSQLVFGRRYQTAYRLMEPQAER